MTVTLETPSVGLDRLNQVCPSRIGRSSSVFAVPRVIRPASRLVSPLAKSTSILPSVGPDAFFQKCCSFLLSLPASPTSIIWPTLSGESIHSIGSPVTSIPSLPQIPASSSTSPPTGATIFVGVSSNCPQRARLSSKSACLPAQSLHPCLPSCAETPCKHFFGSGGVGYAEPWDG